MFAVIFEVHPRTELWETYLGIAGGLRPELEKMDGFIENVRYRSLTREGWLLSLSTWRDEKALVRWRTHALHHDAQSRGRNEIFRDYHLRIGEVSGDTHCPAGSLTHQRLDETVAGAGTAVSLITDGPHPGRGSGAAPEGIARSLGLPVAVPGLVAWDVFEAILTPGDVILLVTWRDDAAAASFERASAVGRARRRRVRIIRDYGMFDRREAPQYYPAPTASGQVSAVQP